MKKTISSERVMTPQQVVDSLNGVLHRNLADCLRDVREAVLAHGGEPGDGMLIRVTVQQEVHLDD